MVERHDYRPPPPPVEVILRAQIVAETHGIGECGMCGGVDVLERVYVEVLVVPKDCPSMVRVTHTPPDSTIAVCCPDCSEYIQSEIDGEDV